MDKEQEELQFLGFFDIWRESFNVISKWSGIFLRLGLSLTLPLSLIILIHTEINHRLLQNMLLTINMLAVTKNDDTNGRTIARVLTKEMVRYTLIQVAYIVLLLIFSLLSTSAIVYTVACIYSSKKVTFEEVLSVVPKVWKRLMVTFVSVMAIMFVYNFLFGFITMVVVLLAHPINFENMVVYILVGVALLILYLGGVCYMSVIWQLANTISVLEESYGLQALRKSKLLMKGKMGISVSIFFVGNLCVAGALHLYKSFGGVDRSNIELFGIVGINIISWLLLTIFMLLVLVVQVVFYFVCKSYHHEEINKSALADHLKIYNGEGYVLLMPKDIQLVEQV